MNYFEEGNKLYNLGKYNKAIELYKKSIDNNTDRPAGAYYNMATCYIKLKKFETAIPLLKESLIFERKSLYFFNLAFCYLKCNNYKKALLYFNVAWSLDPEDVQCKIIINRILNTYSANKN